MAADDDEGLYGGVGGVDGVGRVSGVGGVGRVSGESLKLWTGALTLRINCVNCGGAPEQARITACEAMRSPAEAFCGVLSVVSERSRSNPYCSPTVTAS